MKHEADVLVIGSGIAGLSFALKVAEWGTVNIVTKKEGWESSTNYAQGGIASVLSREDSFEQHLRDTIAGGDGLCHPEVVEQVVREAPERITELVNWGVEFDRDAEDRLALGREGGHSRNRIVHVKDLTGREVERVLLALVVAHPQIQLYTDHTAIDLITEHHLDLGTGTTHCYGAYILENSTGQVHRFRARLTMLATGGAGQVYLHTTNPEIATGDGVAMAYRAGATLGNLEFMQFHPTTLYHPMAASFLITEALRGEGAVLRNKEGAEFITHPQRSLAPRDIVARAIDGEMKRTGVAHLFLDATGISREKLEQRFPHVYQQCARFGIDISHDPIPVVPAAHYMCGGVITDLQGRTSLPGLYACGEVAHTGLHGANRLASNSLLEALVLAHNASLSAREDMVSLTVIDDGIPVWDDSGTCAGEEWILIQHNLHELQTVMWDYVGIVRSRLRLERAQRRINMLGMEIRDYYRKTKVSTQLLELRNLAAIAHLIIKAAMQRTESRGLHYRHDYPERNDRQWQHDTVLQRDSDSSQL
ncbi:MAG: L-aspartate oxidase [Candidatus Delongbacteria bacterium]|nr:L-aspartate oxidase [Candidatus Delongbacteria bacterium]